jgi:translation elongation factor EF-G
LNHKVQVQCYHRRHTPAAAHPLPGNRHRHNNQTGGAGQFGEVFLRIEPLARGSGDISSRHGQVYGTDTLAGNIIRIKGHAPLAELTDFQTRLKSSAAGQGSFSIELSHYEPVSAPLKKQLADQHVKIAHA